MTPIVVAPITADMVAAVARLHIAAFPDAESTLLGRGYVTAFVDWFRRQADGMAFAARSGAITNLPIVLNADVRAMAMARLRLLLQPPSRAVFPSPELPRPTMVLSAIGVSPHWQGRGVGGRLLQEFESAARAHGTQSLRLSVLPHNHSARQLYEHHGWTAGGPVSVKRMSYTRLLGATA